MNIELGNYILTCDTMNFILNEKRIYEKGKHIGEEYMYPIGYYPTFQGLAQKLLQEGLLDAEAATEIKDLKDTLDATMELLTAQLKLSVPTYKGGE